MNTKRNNRNQEIAAKTETTTLTNGTGNTCTSYLLGTTYKDQTATITYGSDGGMNSAFARHHIEAERGAGRVVVLCGGYARIHRA